MKPSGIFIVFEGLDGSGKDTVLNRIMPSFYDEDGSDLFISKYQELVRTREPCDNTRWGKRLIRHLESDTIEKLSARDVLNCYIQDRIEHSARIRQSLKDNMTVLCSRYDLSTFAYQSVMGFSLKEMYRMHRYKSRQGALVPDLTLFFKLDAASAYRRIGKRGGKKEGFEKLDFLKKTAAAYNRTITFLKKKDGRRIAVINADQGRDGVYRDACRAVRRFLRGTGRI